MKEEISTAEKVYNEQIRMWQYRTVSTGQVLITCKTEKGLDSAWKKYLKVWDL